MLPIGELLEFLLKPLFGIVMAVGLWLWKKDKTAIDDHTARIIVLEENLVTEARVRDIIREEFVPVKEDLSEVKMLIQSQSSFQQHMMTELAEARGYRRGQSDTSQS